MTTTAIASYTEAVTEHFRTHAPALSAEIDQHIVDGPAREAFEASCSSMNDLWDQAVAAGVDEETLSDISDEIAKRA